MYKKILGVVYIAMQLTTPILGCDYRSLESNADDYNHNIWSKGSLFPIDHIKDHLSFLEDTKVLKTQSCKVDWEALETEVEQTKNKRFLTFFKNCKEIYNASKSDEKTQVAVSMLFERVKYKFMDDLKILQRMKEVNEKWLSEGE